VKRILSTFLNRTPNAHQRVTVELLETRTFLAASPILIQAENFDPTGYRDTTPTNLGKAYRTTPVDVAICLDSGGGFTISHTKAGEFITLTARVAVTGRYDVQFRVAVATGFGGAVRLEIDGVRAGAQVPVRPTGGWQSWRTVTLTNVPISAGTRKLRVFFESPLKPGADIANLNWVRLIPLTGSTPASVPTWPTSTAAWQTGANAVRAVIESRSAVVNNRLFIFGGWATRDFQPTRAVQVYDPAANSWSTRRDMPAPETHAAVATDPATGLVYFAGGNRGRIPEIVTNELWRYNTVTDAWTRLPNMPQITGGATARVIAGRLHVIGGFGADNKTTRSTHYVLNVANPSAGWSTLASMPVARDHHSSVTVNGQLYVIGGELQHRIGFQHQKLLHRYNALTNTWTQLADMPTGKSHAEDSTFVLNGKIIYAGGQTTPQLSSATVAQYDPATNRWSTVASLPAPRQGAIVTLVGDYLVLTTGGDRADNPSASTWRIKLF